MIGEIGRRSEAIAVDFGFAVNHGHRFKARAEQVQWPFQRLEFNLGQAAKFVVRVEDVAEHVADECGHIGTGIERQPAGLVAKAQRPQVVNAKNVVGMAWV